MALPTSAGAPNRMRQLGQLSSSQLDFGAPHSGHISGLLTMPSVTSSTSSPPNPGQRYNSVYRAQDLKKVTQFLINLFLAVHRVRDFATQQLAIALPQPMDRDPHRAFAHTEVLADLRVSRPVTLA